uniref:Uncharacterized protein n=1 Tax=Glossina palpalis gambiensis TaxID=67801 RepID=A0A1B0B4L4_9MUSC
MRKALKILAGSTNPSEGTIQKINGTYQNNRREYQLFVGQTECVNLSSMVTITCRPPVCPRSTPSTTTVFKSANTVLLVSRPQFKVMVMDDSPDICERTFERPESHELRVEKSSVHYSTVIASMEAKLICGSGC